MCRFSRETLTATQLGSRLEINAMYTYTYIWIFSIDYLSVFCGGVDMLEYL